jgi:hypothetical protein
MAKASRMVRFAEIQPDEAIVATLSQQLSWSRVQALLQVVIGGKNG